MAKFRVYFSGSVEIQAENENSITPIKVAKELGWLDRPDLIIDDWDELENGEEISGD